MVVVVCRQFIFLFTFFYPFGSHHLFGDDNVTAYGFIVLYILSNMFVMGFKIVLLVVINHIITVMYLKLLLFPVTVPSSSKEELLKRVFINIHPTATLVMLLAP